MVEARIRLIEEEKDKEVFIEHLERLLSSSFDVIEENDNDFLIDRSCYRIRFIKQDDNSIKILFSSALRKNTVCKIIFSEKESLYERAFTLLARVQKKFDEDIKKLLRLAHKSRAMRKKP